MHTTSIDELKAKLEEKLGVAASLEAPNRITLNVGVGVLVDAACRLNELGFDHVKAVSGVDYPDGKCIELVYHISSYRDLELAKFIITLKTSLKAEDPRAPSLTPIWLSAELLERETFDLTGIVFEGHPQLKRILLPEDWVGPPPLLKKFKILTEGIEA